MAEVRLRQSGKTALIMGVLTGLLVLLGWFVLFFNQTNRLLTKVQSPGAGSKEISVILVGVTLVGTVGVYLLSTLWKGQTQIAGLWYWCQGGGHRAAWWFSLPGWLITSGWVLTTNCPILARFKLPEFWWEKQDAVLIGFLLMVRWSKNEK